MHGSGPGKISAIIPETAELIAEIPLTKTAITANANQMQQVLKNIVTNAGESLVNGRGKIFISLKTINKSDIPNIHRFPVNWQPRDKSYICLEVKDTGKGINDAEIENLFDPFFTTQFTGRGLGLAVVLGIVQIHNGGIVVKSSPGRGSIFRIFFPISQIESEKPGKMHDPHVISKPGKQRIKPVKPGLTALVVDDDDMVLSLTKAIFEKLGFKVITAKDGIEAVDKFTKNKKLISIVLSDLSMPRMNGWEALEAFRKIRHDIPVILASGYDESYAMKGGDVVDSPQLFIKKPYSIKELENAVARILN